MSQVIYKERNTSICLSLFCVSPDNPNSCVSWHTPAADGTRCGNNLWCHHGECLPIGQFSDSPDLNCDGKLVNLLIIGVLLL